MMDVPANDSAFRPIFFGRRANDAPLEPLQLSSSRSSRSVAHILEGLPDAILVCDLMGTVLRANTAAARYFGVALGEILHGVVVIELMRDVVSEADRQPVVTSEALSDGPDEVGIAARDGKDRDLLVKRVPAFSSGGRRTGWILSLIDLTELRQAQRLRETAMRFLGHDLRAPQAAILTALELYRKNPTALTEEQLHERIERHARKALALSDGFIHLVRAQSQPYRLERCNLVEVLLESIDGAWEATKRRRISIVVAPSPQEAMSLVDREMVERAIGNLLGNALKFSPSETIITCAIESNEAGWAVLVKDQGPGIAANLQTQIFQPFVRGRECNDVDGDGLGLAFVKAVVQCHGGQVLLDSTTDRGSAFRLVFPRA